MTITKADEMFIIVSLQFEGIHQWSKCNIKEVSFLREPHRHIFYVEVMVRVGHDDRDIEIIQLKRQIEKYIKEQVCYHDNDLRDKSCEMIARQLLEKFNAHSVKVLEDGENGALIRRSYG